jgi:hypothetical protein
VNDGRNEEYDSKMMCVVEQLVVVLAEVDSNDNHGCQAKPCKLNNRHREVVVMNLDDEIKNNIMAS